MRALGERAVILDGPEGIRILQQYAAHLFAEREGVFRLHLDRDAARGATRLHDVDRLRVTVVRHDEFVPSSSNDALAIESPVRSVMTV